MFIPKREIQRDGISQFLIQADIAQQVRPHARALDRGAIRQLSPCGQTHGGKRQENDG
jgi:hypothetical protein